MLGFVPVAIRLRRQQSVFVDQKYFSSNLGYYAIAQTRRKVKFDGRDVDFEMLFKHVEEQNLKSGDGLQFLPDVYAEALEAGVFQALVDLSTRRKNIPQL